MKGRPKFGLTSPAGKGRELIKKVWEADPLLCPKCSREMRIVALIDDREVIERILCHLGLWRQGVRVFPARAPPELDEWVIESCYNDPFPCLPRRSEAKTGLRHRTGYDVRERLSPRARSVQPPNGDFPLPARPSGRSEAASNRPEGLQRLCLTHPAPSHTLHIVTSLLQTGFNEHLPAPPEKRFLISLR